MSVLSITLTDERAQQLDALSKELGLPPEELARVAIEGLLSRPRPDFETAAKQVLEKNAELYRRLAQ